MIYILLTETVYHTKNNNFCLKSIELSQLTNNEIEQNCLLKDKQEISEVVSKSTRKKFTQSWVFNILKRENKIPPNEAIIRHNICNVELQSNICDV